MQYQLCTIQDIAGRIGITELKAQYYAITLSELIPSVVGPDGRKLYYPETADIIAEAHELFKDPRNGVFTVARKIVSDVVNESQAVGSAPKSQINEVDSTPKNSRQQGKARDQRVLRFLQENAKDNKCVIAISRLAKETRMSATSAGRALDSLKRQGVLTTSLENHVNPKTGKKRMTTVITLEGGV